jgi:hypothetical protein
MIVAKNSNITLSCGTEQSKFNSNQIRWKKVDNWISNAKKVSFLFLHFRIRLSFFKLKTAQKPRN